MRKSNRYLEGMIVKTLERAGGDFDANNPKNKKVANIIAQNPISNLIVYSSIKNRKIRNCCQSIQYIKPTSKSVSKQDHSHNPWQEWSCSSSTPRHFPLSEVRGQ